MAKKKNPRVGCKGSKATHMLPTSFAHTPISLVSRIQKQYATGFYTQRELAEQHDLSIGIVNKACRVADENLDKAMRVIRARLKGGK